MMAAGRASPAPKPLPGWTSPCPKVELSIEVFPPKGPEAAARLWAISSIFVAGAALHLRHLRCRRRPARTARCRSPRPSRTASASRSRRT